MSALKSTLLAIGTVAVLATPVFAQNIGSAWELREGSAYVIDMQGKMMVMSMDATKHHRAMMRGARVVPRGTMFFVSDGKLYMKTGKVFDRAGQFMFQ